MKPILDGRGKDIMGEEPEAIPLTMESWKEKGGCQ
jgi:hypothetical protein